MRESACYCNCNHEQCPSCDYRVRLMNERWPPTPPLHRLPALRSVIVASNRRAGLCRFVRPACRNPLASIFSPCPLCPYIILALRITSVRNTTGLIYFKGNLSAPRNGPGRFCCCQSTTLACFIPHPAAHRPAHLSRRSALQLALSRAALG